MNYFTVLLVSVALGIDAFSLAIGIGLTGIKKREMYILSGVITLFHIFMPLLGLSLGTYLGRIAGPVAGSIGALVLIAIGVSAIWNNLRQAEPKKKVIDISSFTSLILLATSVSLDALTVGIGLGVLQADLLLTVITMGIIAGLMTMSGLLFGRALKHNIGEKAGIIGGLILIIIGLKLLVW